MSDGFTSTDGTTYGDTPSPYVGNSYTPGEAIQSPVDTRVVDTSVSTDNYGTNPPVASDQSYEYSTGAPVSSYITPATDSTQNNGGWVVDTSANQSTSSGWIIDTSPQKITDRILPSDVSSTVYQPKTIFDRLPQDSGNLDLNNPQANPFNNVFDNASYTPPDNLSGGKAMQGGLGMSAFGFTATPANSIYEYISRNDITGGSNGTTFQFASNTSQPPSPDTTTYPPTLSPTPQQSSQSTSIYDTPLTNTLSSIFQKIIKNPNNPSNVADIVSTIGNGVNNAIGGFGGGFVGTIVSGVTSPVVSALTNSNSGLSNNASQSLKTVNGFFDFTSLLLKNTNPISAVGDIGKTIDTSLGVSTPANQSVSATPSNSNQKPIASKTPVQSFLVGGMVGTVGLILIAFGIMAIMVPQINAIANSQSVKSVASGSRKLGAMAA